MSFTMPSKSVVVHFYCKDTTRFDNSWEKAVRAGGAVEHDDFEYSIAAPGATCKNYRLAHPGGIKSLVEYDKFYPLRNPTYVGSGLRDQENYAVTMKERTTDPYFVYLEDIVNSINPVGSVCHVHWLACRENITGEESTFEANCRGTYGGLYTEKQKEEVGKIDKTASAPSAIAALLKKRLQN